MSEIAFNNFGYAAKLNTKIDPFILSSRYFHQIDLKPLVLKHSKNDKYLFGPTRIDILIKKI